MHVCFIEFQMLTCVNIIISIIYPCKENHLYIPFKRELLFKFFYSIYFIVLAAREYPYTSLFAPLIYVERNGWHYYRRVISIERQRGEWRREREIMCM